MFAIKIMKHFRGLSFALEERMFKMVSYGSIVTLDVRSDKN